MEENSYYISLRGKANIPEKLELGSGYKVSLDGEVISVTEHNNQNGSKDLVFAFKPALCEIVDDRGKVIKARDLRSRSQQLRRMLKSAWESDATADPDHEKSYDHVMKYILSKAYDLYEEAKTKNS